MGRTGGYPADLAVERVAAAVKAKGDGSCSPPAPRRSCCPTRTSPRSSTRLQRFAAAGADVVYAPGLARPADIATVVSEVDVPVNVLLRPGGPTVAELADLGVARISVGGAFAFACLGALEKAARGCSTASSPVGRHDRGRQARPPRLRVMSYTGTEGETSAVFRRDLDPLMLGATAATFVAPGSVTNGEFGLFRWDIPARAGGAGGHFHRGFSESFYVVSGTVTLYNGEIWGPLPAGGFCYVPPGGVHGFRNDADEPASMLILFAPGIARERYFEELAEIRRTGAELSEQEWADFFARHDQVNL